MAHLCHWPGCRREVPPKLWGCAEHWRTLPSDLRAKIWATYVAGQEISKTPSEDYIRAAQDVQAWIAKEFGGQVKEHDRGRWDRLRRTIRTKDEQRKAAREARAKEASNG